MKIYIAKDAGYCFGVRDAVNMAYDAAAEHGEVYMLGTIVHNERVIENLNNAGAKVVKKIDEVPDGKTLLFRAHGTVPKLWEEAKKENINLVDGTCPLVTEIHHEIKLLQKEGRKTIIIGDHGHDEVVAIAAQVEKPIIIANIDEAKKMRKIKRAGIDNNLTYGVVLTGGGSQLRNIVALANDLLDMPIRLGRPINHLLGNKDFADEPVHSTILGLLLWPLFSNEQKNIQNSTLTFFESIKRIFKKIF